MNNWQKVFVVVVLVATVTSLAAAYPLTNVVVNDNKAGWFTLDNIEKYGDDLDDRVEPGGTVFTGHPAYVMESENARLVLDMPRVHYYAITFTNTDVGNAMFRNLTTAFESGKAKYAVSGPMTQKILELNQTARRAFVDHYCRVETDGLYNRTHANLYKWVPDSSDCPPDHRVNVGNMTAD